MALKFDTKPAKGSKKPPKAEPIEFELDGETFTFDPPDSNLLILSAVQASAGARQTASPMAQLGAIKAMLDYFDAGLSDLQADRIKDRLYDPKDPLTVIRLSEMVAALVEEQSERPTK